MTDVKWGEVESIIESSVPKTFRQKIEFSHLTLENFLASPLECIVIQIYEQKRNEMQALSVSSESLIYAAFGTKQNYQSLRSAKNKHLA